MPKRMNRVIRFLIASDFFLLGGWGLLSPVFAIFILENIALDPAKAAEVAGFSALTYWGVKSLLQIPTSKYFDRVYGEKDDYWMMILGLFINGIAPFGFLFAKTPFHIYGIQIVHALGMSLVIPSWNAIFTRHIDKGREAYEWAMDSTSLGLATGITGGIGGIVAALFGFKLIFVLVGTLTLFAALLLLFIRKDVLPMDRSLDNLFSRLNLLTLLRPSNKK